MIWNRFRKRLHQQNVDHRSFVDHEQITIKGIVGVAFEPAALGIDFQEPSIVVASTPSPRSSAWPPASRSAEERSHAFGNEVLNRMTIVVLPTPGPPVITDAFAISAKRIAAL